MNIKTRAVIVLALAATLTGCASSPAAVHSEKPTPTTLTQKLEQLHTTEPTTTPELAWVSWYRAQPAANTASTDGDIITTGKLVCAHIKDGTVNSIIADPKKAEPMIAELKATLCP